LGGQARLLKLDRRGYQMVAETRWLIEESWALLEESLVNDFGRERRYAGRRSESPKRAEFWRPQLWLWL
jgi:hypothetical protein